MSKYIPVAKEQYVTLKNFSHFGCTVIPFKLLEEGKLLTKVVYCSHGNTEITIERKDI